MDVIHAGVIKDKLKRFIYDNFPLAGTMNLTTDQNMLESGAVDSMGLLTIIGFIEDEFGIQVTDDEVVMENFRTMDAIATFIQRSVQIGSGLVP